MRPTWADDFPRLYDLYIASNQENEQNYFSDFHRQANNTWERPHYTEVEGVLQRLDAESWEVLKKKARPFVCIRDSLRGWQQLFDLLNEARAYLYLRTQGYRDVRVLPEQAHKTPDIEAKQGDDLVVVEVKTVNISTSELEYLEENERILKENPEGVLRVRNVPPIPSEALKNKILETINVAKEQLKEYSVGKPAHNLVYLVINLDWLCRQNRDVADELKAFVTLQSDETVEVMSEMVYAVLAGLWGGGHNKTGG